MPCTLRCNSTGDGGYAIRLRFDLAMLFMAFMDRHAHLAVLSANLVLFGAGIGILFPLFMLTAQNAVGYENLGAVTSCAKLIRQMVGSVMGLPSILIVICYLQEIPLLKRNTG